MTYYGQQQRIKTMEDVIEVMNKIMFGMETHDFDHQYHQVLQIHRETAKIESRLDNIEDKLNIILNKICMPEDIKKLEEVKKTKDKISEDMKGMRKSWDN